VPNPWSFTARGRHDIAVVSALPDGEVPVGQPVAVQAELFNAGDQVESGVPVTCTIADVTGTLVYAETVSHDEIQPLVWAMVALPDWEPAVASEHVLTCRSAVPGDADPGNDVYAQTVSAVHCAPDVWTKDNEDDDGDVPCDHPWFESPDLWVRNEADGGTEHQNPIPGAENTIYVRVRNRGCRTAAWGNVYLYGGPAKTGWSCLGAEPNIGTIAFSDLAPGEEQILSIAWTPDEGPNLGIRSVIEADGDPVTWMPGCAPHQPRFDNNISWRNVHVIDNRGTGKVRAAAGDEVAVVLNNVYAWPKTVDLVIERLSFPAAGTATVLLPDGLFDRWQAYGGAWSDGVEVDAGTREIRVGGAISATIGAIPMRAGEEATVTLRFDAPSGAAFELRLYSRVDGIVVGGITSAWTLPEADLRVYLPLVLRER
jgi:hypothetical protein